jgi:hypothetical protein
MTVAEHYSDEIDVTFCSRKGYDFRPGSVPGSSTPSSGPAPVQRGSRQSDQGATGGLIKKSRETFPRT